MYKQGLLLLSFGRSFCAGLWRTSSREGIFFIIPIALWASQHIVLWMVGKQRIGGFRAKVVNVSIKAPILFTIEGAFAVSTLFALNPLKNRI